MVLGITGGVGTGKSTILNILEEDYGAFTILADDVARDLLLPGEAAYEETVSCFGPGILTDGFSSPIDRKALADIVFHDPEKLKKLNEMTHPRVKERILEKIREFQNQGKELIVIEAALLIQAGYLDMLDYLWVIIADTETRVERLRLSRGYSREKTLSMIRNQMPDAEMETYADAVINNSHGLESTRRQIKKALALCVK